MSKTVPASPAISTVLFDLGNVLIDVDFGRSFAHWAAAAGVPAADLQARFRTGVDYQRHERGELDAAGYFRSLEHDLGIRLDEPCWLAGWNALLLDEMPGIRVLLDAIRPDVPCFVFSNTNVAHADCFLPRHAGLLRRFSQVFLSSSIGHRKPERAAFDAVVRAIGVPAATVLFFDDNADNVAGARAAGLQAEQVRTLDDIAGPLGRAGLLR